MWRTLFESSAINQLIRNDHYLTHDKARVYKILPLRLLYPFLDVVYHGHHGYALTLNAIKCLNAYLANPLQLVQIIKTNQK